MAFRVLRRPSPAMVVACVALIVALSGTGYAAIKLPAKSVGAKQLKTGAVTNIKLARRAVTGGKVARNTLTGTQIDEATLGTVRNATHAATAGDPRGHGGLGDDRGHGHERRRARGVASRRRERRASLPALLAERPEHLR